MEVLIATMAMLSVAFAAAGCAVVLRRRKVKCDKRMILTYAVLMSVVVSVFLDMLASGERVSLSIVSMDFFPSAVALWVLSSSLAGIGIMKRMVALMVVVVISIISLHVVRLVVDLDFPSADFPVMMLSSIIVMLTLLFVYGLIIRLRNIKELMGNGTIWAVVCIVVDIVYFCFMLLGAAFVQMKLASVGVLLFCGLVMAAGVRILTDSKFIILHKQENLIIESMKITSVSSASDASRIEDVYKELYERMVTYFEVNKPYLDNDLTVSDLARELYSNKMYVSKSISQFTGRNFCQFVNYYRVRHAMDSFRNNPELRVNELALTSGFNSVVSFTMAFRLFMGETPSEWCRKEKSRLIKRGK